MIPAVQPQLPLPFNINKMRAVAEACKASGFYKDCKDANKALVKMMAGHELGFGPSASLSGIYIVQDKIVLSYPMLGTLIKRSGRYDFRIKKHTDEICEIDFFEIIDGKRTLVGTSSFSLADATKAGLLSNPTWKKYPRNMLYARALGNGQKWYAPDVSGGSPVYTPDEMGMDEDEDGNPKNANIEEAEVAITAASLSRLQELIRDTHADVQAIFKHYDVSELNQFSEQSARMLINILETRLSLNPPTSVSSEDPAVAD